MNFTVPTRVAQASRSLSVVALSAAMFACGSKRTSVATPPSDPEATVVEFLSAVRAQDIQSLAGLWGSSKGLAADRIDQSELERRLTVMQIYLQHEEYAILPDARDPTVAVERGERVVMVRLTRNGCTPQVPFTLSPFGNGWLVRDVKLEAAGNPARICAPPGIE